MGILPPCSTIPTQIPWCLPRMERHRHSWSLMQTCKHRTSLHPWLYLPRRQMQGMHGIGTRTPWCAPVPLPACKLFASFMHYKHRFPRALTSACARQW